MNEVTAKPTVEAAKPHAKRPALGRGLGALLGETRREAALNRVAQPVVSDESAAPQALVVSTNSAAPQAVADAAVAVVVTSQRDSGLAMLPVAEIEPHPDQPRRHFDEAALDELAQSIAQRGVIQPVIVRPLPSGHYQLVAGERRWRAAQRARIHEIPALIRQLDDREVTALALIENLQREDLNPVEEARAYQRLSEHEGMTQQEIARLVDKSRSHVANIMRLLGLPDGVLDMIEQGTLSMGHARALLGLEDPTAVARDVVAKDLSVRDVERIARRALRSDGVGPRRARAERSGSSADLAALEAHVEEFLGLKVTIHPEGDSSTGLVTIRYASLDQLDLVCQRLTGGAI